MEPFERIKEAILVGTLYPGKRLKEELLAKELNVSRTPIREALQKLESDGLVIPLPRRGFIVRDFSMDDIRQIYDIRALLESYAASEAALRRNENDITRMKKFNDDFEKAIYKHDKSNLASVKNIQKANQFFHDTVFEATKNQFLKYHISKVTVVPLIFRSYFWFSKQQLIQSLDAHRIIVKAIQRMEPERARAAMQEHIFRGRDYVLENGDKIKNKLLEGENDDQYL